ncbi:MAG: HlyD family efflux transporter periplasmic adaptor subunit [Alphaproteobacteria bacterium]|nr:HlyD family efflux transporter periplasmic adaptor subunit [Alphaproteobacteria bacterium]
MTKKSILFIVLFVLILGGAYFFLFSGRSSKQSLTISPTEEMHQATSTTSGTITSKEDVSLDFEESGTIKKIFVKVGQKVQSGEPLVQLENEDLDIQLEIAQHNVQEALFKEDELFDGQTDLEKALSDNALASANQKIQNMSRSALIGAQRTAFDIERSVRINLDPYFKNPRGADPAVTISLGVLETQSINDGKKILEHLIKAWRQWAVRTTENPNTLIVVLQSFLHDLRMIDTHLLQFVSSTESLLLFEDTSSNEYTKVSELRQLLLSAIERQTTILNDLQIAVLQYEQSLAQYNKDTVGVRIEQAQAQNSNVAEKQARVKEIQKRIQSLTLRAPFSGTVGSFTLNRGKNVSKGTTAIRMVADDYFIAKTKVTEIDVKNISVGKELSAYIPAFDAIISTKVFSISSTETKLDGVPVYEVEYTLSFPQEHARLESLLRTGMSVDIKIPLEELRPVLTLPQDVITRKKNTAFVTLIRDGKEEDVPVELGVSLDGGKVEIKRGLTKDDVVFQKTP